VKALILVAVHCVVLLVVFSWLFRTFTIEKRANALLMLWVLSVPLYVGVYTLTPSNLGFLPPEAVDSPTWAGLAFGIAVYVAAFFGGLLQLYQLTERGFSLRILIDVHDTPGEAMTLDDVIKRYSCGRGMDWMYQKRLDGLLQQRLIEPTGNDHLQNTSRGHRVARAVSAARTFVRLGVWT
jgi:hypothetical protein